MKLPLAILLAVLGACQSTHAPDRATTAPPKRANALSPEQRQRIDALFAAWVHPDSPGCAVGVIQAGELVHARGYGSANLEHDVANTSRTVFDIGSTSKQFTAACIGLLAQEGRLAVTDDVRKLVPELPDYGTAITIDHLMRHTSGLRDYLTLFALAGIATEDLTDDATALAMLTRQKELEFEPGTEHRYSNSGYFLLSVIVERASGKSLAEFARERIFEPLAMRDTHIHDDHTLLVRGRATGYSAREQGGFGIDMSDFEQTGDGAVMTTVEDLARWDANFYEPVVGGAALIEFLREHGELADGTRLEYCRGLFRGEHEGLAFESHGGSWAGYRAEMLRFPSEHTTVITLANLSDSDPSDLCWRTAAIVLGERLAPDEPAEERERPAESAVAPPELSLEAASSLAGDYECNELGVVYTVALRDGALTLALRGRESMPLAPVERDVLDAQGVLLRFERDADDRATSFCFDAGRVSNLRCTRVRCGTVLVTFPVPAGRTRHARPGTRSGLSRLS